MSNLKDTGVAIGMRMLRDAYDYVWSLGDDELVKMLAGAHERADYIALATRIVRDNPELVLETGALAMTLMDARASLVDDDLIAV